MSGNTQLSTRLLYLLCNYLLKVLNLQKTHQCKLRECHYCYMSSGIFAIQLFLDCKTLRESLVIFWLLFIRHFSCLDGFFFPVSVCLFPEGYLELLRIWPEWGILEISIIMDNYGGSVFVNMKEFLNDSLRIQKRLGANQMKMQHVSPVKKQEWVTPPKQHQTGSADPFHQFCAGFHGKICRFLCISIWTVSKLGRG